MRALTAFGWRRHARFGWIALTLVAVSLFMPVSARATAAPVARQSAAPPASGHVTILVLDMSGSMGRPGQGGNDPDGLRCSAAHAYIDLSGPGQWIGLVGLSHPEGAPGNPEIAQEYAQPAEMSTDAARSAMRTALDTRSNQCLGSGTTPMADALARAEQMLVNVTKSATLSGSVILLTDGLPDPNAESQLGTIRAQLPTFVAHNWPIDTIALGDADRIFLRGLADATGGTAYDVANGPVPGISPLNLEPFFLDIYRVNSGRTLLHAVTPLTLTGNTARQFHVGRFIAHMDVLVVRDTPNVAVQLYAPGNYPNAPVQPNQARLVETDPHYAIFALDAPIPGDWTLAFSGSGQVLADSLLQSTLALQLVSPRANQHLPVALPLTLDAALRDGQDQVLAEPVTMTATLDPANGTDRTASEVPMTDPGGASPTGNYAGHVTLPSSAPRGTYQITLEAQLNDATVSLVVPVVFEAFPTPALLSPSDGKPQLTGLTQAVVPGAPLTVAFGLTVDGVPQAEPNVTAALAFGGTPVPLSTLAGTWQGIYVPAAAGAQPLVVQLSGSYHGTALGTWPYTLPLSVSLRPTLSVGGVDARRPYPAHRTLNITLAYFRQAGVPDPNAAGHITALLLPPDGIGLPVALQPRLDASGHPEPGAYTAALNFGTPGTYTLHATFDNGAAADHSEQVFVLRVIDFPTAVTTTTAPGQTLTNWGPLGGLYTLPLVRWFSAWPLAGSPSQPTASVRGQVQLAGHAYTGGTVRATVNALGSDHTLPVQVIQSGADYDVRFQPSAPGAYQIAITWVGDFAGLRADQEVTVNLVQASIVAPTFGAWARGWAFTVLYGLLLALLLQLVRFGFTAAPAGALQASDRPDDLYPMEQHRTPLVRRFLWRNRVRTADLGLPPGAELRFRRHAHPLVVRDAGARTDTTVLVGGTVLRSGAPAIELGEAALAFQANTARFDLDADVADARPLRARRSQAADRATSAHEDSATSTYVYLSPAEVRERREHEDPFGGYDAGRDEIGEDLDGARARPRSMLGQMGALVALFIPTRRAPVDADDALDAWSRAEELPKRRRERGRAERLDEFELDLPRARGRPAGRHEDLDELDTHDGRGGASVRQRRSTDDRHDDPRSGGAWRKRHARGADRDDDLAGQPRRSRHNRDDRLSRDEW